VACGNKELEPAQCNCWDLQLQKLIVEPAAAVSRAWLFAAAAAAAAAMKHVALCWPHATKAAEKPWKFSRLLGLNRTEWCHGYNQT
jgi:hypothetical protein